ncbi:hypothetical protein [Methanocella conradii]|uniref:hypothetical protein n=1 Tax=Methanocella conradii TaxID=1175444 RepID=UPI0024B34C9F|nr:hypothetical protein [Methanocella conradii]MDI6896276.1 hypothetical protein [Methanocella conradii]
MCELAVFINENGTSRRVARCIVRAEAGEGCTSLLGSNGKVIKIEGAIIVRLDVIENELMLETNKSNS